MIFHNHISFVMILSFHSMKGKICARLPTSSFPNWGGFQCYGCQWWRSCFLWWMAEPAHCNQNGLDCWNWILDLIFAIIPYWFMFMISPWPVYEIFNLKINEFETKSFQLTITYVDTSKAHFNVYKRRWSKNCSFLSTVLVHTKVF